MRSLTYQMCLKYIRSLRALVFPFLAGGSTAICYLAEDVKNARSVALKARSRDGPSDFLVGNGKLAPASQVFLERVSAASIDCEVSYIFSQAHCSARS